MSTYDMILLGDYFFDQIFVGLDRFPQLGCEIECEELVSTGGAMFTTAVTLSRLGARVGWPACFGTDYYSRYVHELAEKEGVNLSLVHHLDRPYRRVTTAMPFEGDRAFVTYTDPDEDSYRYWLKVLAEEDYKHIHIGGLMPAEQVQPISELAHARGATVSMDCHDSPLLEKPCSCRDSLPLVDVFTPNAREAIIVSERETLTAALERLMLLCRTVVIKDGPRGAWVGHQGQISHVPTIDAGPPIDTTGAGDCFNGGLLYGCVVEGLSITDSARYGNICGGLSVTGVGGATRAPTHAELLTWLERLP